MQDYTSYCLFVFVDGSDNQQMSFKRCSSMEDSNRTKRSRTMSVLPEIRPTELAAQD